MSNLLSFEVSISTATSSFLNNNNNSHMGFFSFNEKSSLTTVKIPFILSSSTKHKRTELSHSSKPKTLRSTHKTSTEVCGVANAEVEVEQAEKEVAEGYTLTQFCDKIIDVFLNEKPRVKEWRKYLVFREEWNKYRESFYNRCQTRADEESDSNTKEKLISLASKLKKIDDEMERHSELLKEIQDSPTDVNAVVARRRRDFTGEFFRYLILVSETHDSLEDRDAVARLATKCLSAVSAYDNTLEYVDTLDTAQAKFDDILNSPSINVACEKIKSLAKAKELDSSLILLINSAWASAKASKTMKNEVKDIMYRLYKVTKSSLRSIAPNEIKLLKYLLNIIDPEERFSALATAFSPGDEHEAKDPKALHTTPKELHKWITIMLDAYHLNKEESDIREAKQMTQPVVIQRLFILKETIEEEYLEKRRFQAMETKDTAQSEEL
ncbi:Endoribonuclease E-like protein [Melia azedarach]|uniref:Endoribonuclease E-like protein n=1 Tax=Melia azedarach TaxID=155640 RepID=A0ACC1XUM6_MELAZ|nr:Endoribonuclease E-like protein [Melia azedarach]